MLDNHHTSNVIFAALNVDGVTPLPPEVWDRVREVREALLRTIEELSPPDWSFVFTNVLTDDKPGDRAVWSDSVRSLNEQVASIYPCYFNASPTRFLRGLPIRTARPGPSGSTCRPFALSRRRADSSTSAI